MKSIPINKTEKLNLNNFMHGLIKRNPGEVEFHQAVEEVAKTIIPFINENSDMRKALNLITKKKLGVLIAINKKKLTTGIITDGQIRRSSQKNNNLKNLLVKNVMTKNPYLLVKKSMNRLFIALKRIEHQLEMNLND